MTTLLLTCDGVATPADGVDDKEYGERECQELSLQIPGRGRECGEVSGERLHRWRHAVDDALQILALVADARPVEDQEDDEARDADGLPANGPPLVEQRATEDAA